MTYEAVKELAKYIGYLTGLISVGTVMGIAWNAISGMLSQDSNGYAAAKMRIKNLLLAFVISLILTGGLMSWAAGYIDGVGNWVSKIVGWSQ